MNILPSVDTYKEFKVMIWKKNAIVQRKAIRLCRVEVTGA